MAQINKFLALLHPRYWVAWLGIGFLWLLIQLPYRWQIKLGKNLGHFLFIFPTKLKRITETNIQLCFPQLSTADQQTLVKNNFASLGIGLIEAAIAWWMPDDKLSSLFQIYGLEHIEKAFAAGKGIILLGPHFICLELVGRLISMHYQFAVMYRPHKKSFIAFIQERFRKKHYLHYIPRNRIRELIRALNNNIAVWYAYDIDAGEKSSVFAPFFGVPTASLTSVSRLIDLTGAAVIPMSFFRNSDDEFHYEVHLYPALDNLPTGNLVEDATILNTALQQAICQKPEQYVWQYKRFKTRPKGQDKIY